MLQSLQSEGSILGFRHFLLLLSTSGQGLPIDLLCRVKKSLGQVKSFEDAKVWWNNTPQSATFQFPLLPPVPSGWQTAIKGSVCWQRRAKGRDPDQQHQLQMKRPTEVCLLLFFAGALCSDPVQRSSSTTETHELSEIDGHPVEEDKTTTRTTDGNGMMSETTEWSTRALPERKIASESREGGASQTHAQVEEPPQMEVPPEMNNIMSVPPASPLLLVRSTQVAHLAGAAALHGSSTHGHTGRGSGCRGGAHQTQVGE